MMHRRDLFNTAMTVGAASLLGSESAAGAAQPDTPRRIVDTNISLFQWPFRRLPLDDPETLIAKLRALGITEAWAGSFEGLLHRDIAEVNRRLAETCRRHAELVPIGSVNLDLPGWQDDLGRCIEQHNMPGIRLHPNYHGYTLADRSFQQLLERATSAGRFIQIAAAMEDTRTQHPMLRADDVDLAPLTSLMRDNDGAQVQILNLRPRGPLLENLANTPGVYFDTSRVEGTDGIAKLMRSVPNGRVMFGTHAPFLIPEAALIRTYESDLDDEELLSLLSASADSLRSLRRS
jgi:predicted TIM-barrel fold metal-dependent hydrolase